MKRSTLIVPTPIKLRHMLRVEDIYKILICDFYAKTLRKNGENVLLPFLISVRGEPIRKLSAKLQINSHGILAAAFIEKFRKEFKEYSVTPTLIIRDDIINDVPSQTNLTSAYMDRKEILQKIQKINFIPTSAKDELISFVERLSEEDIACLGEPNNYIAFMHGIQVASWCSTITTIPAIKRETFITNIDNIVYIQNSEDKDFICRALTCLSDDDIPNISLTHGNILDADGNKLQGFNIDGNWNPLTTLYHGGLRAALLTLSARDDITVSSTKVQNATLEIERFSRLCDEVGASQNFSDLASDHHSKERFDRFYDAVTRWRFPQAFIIAKEIVCDYKQISKKEKLSARDHLLVDFLKELYFGKQ